VDEEYFKVVVKPLLDDPRVEFVGEIDEKDKQGFLGNAYALLFPIEWPEPFGLVMIEAMACGTPVVAYRRGSTPEIIDHGVTGFLVDDLDSAVRTVHRVGALDRKRIREAFNQRFTARRMARDYLSAYMALREIGLPPFKVA
jgi:glycosyltransferase involved in cell wall biosynthesis